MTQQRPLSPFEISYFGDNTQLGPVPIGGMPLYIGSTVRGGIDAPALERVLAELTASHVLLRSNVVTDGDGVQRFEIDDDYRPALEVRAGDVDEYWELVNTRPEWREGLFRAVLLRGAEHTRIVLVIHHGISDGRSAFALLDEMWRRYTAQVAGSPLPPLDSDRALVSGVDIQLMDVTTDAEVDAMLAEIIASATAFGPEAAPRMLPRDGDGIGDPGGRLALRRIELSTRRTAAVVAAARAHGISVNSLLSGAALAAVRPEIDSAAGPMVLNCGHAADLRSELSPRLPDSTVLNCASGGGTPAIVDLDADPIELGTGVDVLMHQVLETRFPALFMRASQRELDPETAALFSDPPTIALSNIGRLHAHSLPAGVTKVRDDIFAMAPGMPPKMTIFTVGDRLTIQVEYDTAEHSHAQMGRIAEGMNAQIQRALRADATLG